MRAKWWWRTGAAKEQKRGESRQEGVVGITAI